MLHAFIRNAKLCSWLSRADCPPAIQECKVLFDRMYAPKSATSIDEEHDEDLLDDSVQVPSSALPAIIPKDLYTLIKRQKVVLRARLKFNGVIYSRASTHVGNSQVLVYPQATNYHLLFPAVFGISMLHPQVNWCLLYTDSSRSIVTTLLIHLLCIQIFLQNCIHQALVVP
jgi:hypothetical protein